MADDGWDGLDLLWEAALSRESADADLSYVVDSEITSSTPAVTLLYSPGQLSMTLPGNQPKGSGTSSMPSVTRGRPAQNASKKTSDAWKEDARVMNDRRKEDEANGARRLKEDRVWQVERERFSCC
ncbi:hypothetical protein RvY_08624 [Ramazzottius varieornatus]|uniref:Uncharacterized protein n=1 Tax=Ramazzottius varieornatus TaxID=947166 RepID=A0A1D1VEI9_RAMVA|nr:hypothetical protein RvY_08624 [Ramazzottius varieornatus]